jgi:multidrug efflux system membrane fusion protein
MTTARTVLTVMTAAALAAGCSRVQGREPRPARPVKAQAVALAPPEAVTRYSVTIEAFEQVPLAFKSAGYVDAVLQQRGADGRSRAAQPGDRIGRGTVLARVRDADYRERVHQGRARLAESEAALTKARLDLARARTLFDAESLTKPDLDAAQAAFDSADARVAAARADVELATIALRDCALVSPATAIVLERRIETGSLVTAGTVGFLVGDLSSVKARFGIPDAIVSTVRPGEPIGVTVEAMSGAAFDGRVTAVAPAADPQSRVFDVEVTIPNRDGRLRPGMIGTVVLGSARIDRAASGQPRISVPLTAIVRAGEDEKEYALLVVERQGDGEIARLRRVGLGDVIGNGVTVTSGLILGERVIVSGAQLLADGEAVRVIP